jgi:hypothetical protein
VEDRISNDRLERLLGSEKLSRQEARDTVRRLLAGTPRFTSRANRLRPGLADETTRYDEAFRKTELRLAEAHEHMRRERHLAGLQWGALEGHPRPAVW